MSKLTKYEALQKQLIELENDPALIELLSKRDDLIAIINNLGLSEEDAAHALLPENEANGEKLVYLDGLLRMPIKVEKKLNMHSNLLSIRDEVDRRIARLEEDPVIKSRSILLEKVLKLGVTPADAAELLLPGLSAGNGEKPIASKSSDIKGTKASSVRYWRNPHTQQVVSARTTNKKEIQEWKAEFGNGIVTDWEISEAEAKQYSK